MVVARASGTLMASSLKQNRFWRKLVNKLVFLYWSLLPRNTAVDGTGGLPHTDGHPRVGWARGCPPHTDGHPMRPARMTWGVGG